VRARSWAAAALGWAGLIFWASHQSNPFPMLPSELLSHDKLIHAGVFAVLAFLVRGALAGRALPPARAWLLASSLALGWGILDELHQSFIPNRSCDVNDALADAAGAALGAWLAGGGLRRVGSGASIRG
jgi:VanZ family protein